MHYLLAIDQGTTSSRAILFDSDLRPVAASQREITQYFPRSGWVEQDAEEIWLSSISCCQSVLSGIDVSEVAAIGITNQRETVVVWDRDTGKPVGNAIVWQDRRTSDICAKLAADGWEADISRKTGLLLDPYFSATKLAWILDQTDGARAQAKAGQLLFGTVDSFLIWNLTGGVHATDATNASRTMLCDIGVCNWDGELLRLFGIPPQMLPMINDCAADFGFSERSLLGASIPIRGVAGDQQAAAVGQACFRPGMIKSTYGTGCFVLLNTGTRRIASRNRLLSTVAYRLDDQTIYALEGSIYTAGSVVQWMRDGLGVITEASETQALAEQADTSQNIYFVPAFTGLGAPYWDSDCRGAIYGLTRASGPAEIARAALESVAFQTRDLLEAMLADLPEATGTMIRVDGGMSSNDWVMQFLADQIGLSVDRPEVTETTALGAAYLAGFQTGLFPSPSEFEGQWKLERRFEPQRGAKATMDRAYQGWKDAVQRTLSDRTVLTAEPEHAVDM